MKIPQKNTIVSQEEIKELCELYGRRELWARIETNPPAKPFKSDGCSMWPDNWRGVDMYEDCFLHDLEYWVGGSCADRLVADAMLMIGIAKKGSPRMAELMFSGVRLGGHEKMPASWRWGFGHG